jgi:UTP-glucose-1-phosphate uridylyltransferase
MRHMDKTLVVMAAGMGSRFGGLKQMEGVGPRDQTILEYSLFDAWRAGFTKVVFIIRQEMMETFRDRVTRRLEGAIPMVYQFQALHDLPEGFSAPPERTKPWGTAHAVWVVREVVNEPFAVINADDFYGRDAFSQAAHFLDGLHDRNASAFGMVAYRLDRTLSLHGSVARGICQNNEDTLATVQEHTQIARREDRIEGVNQTGEMVTLSASALVSMNFWLFTPALFPLLDQALVAFLQSHGCDLKAECYLPSVVDSAITSGKVVRCHLPGRFGGGARDFGHVNCSKCLSGKALARRLLKDLFQNLT